MLSESLVLNNHPGSVILSLMMRPKKKKKDEASRESRLGLLVSKCRQSLRKAEDRGLLVEREVRGIPVCLEGEGPSGRLGEQVVLSPFARSAVLKPRGQPSPLSWRQRLSQWCSWASYCTEVSLGELQHSLPVFQKRPSRNRKVMEAKPDAFSSSHLSVVSRLESSD